MNDLSSVEIRESIIELVAPRGLFIALEKI